MHDLWTPLASRAGITLSVEQEQQLSRYLDLLESANATMNLTRIAGRAAAELQHVGDALTLLQFLPARALRLADVGSGGGVPGIPLAIVRPDVLVTLIEATQKKAAFLESAAAELKLGNVRIVAARAEDVGNGEARQTFDIAVARAVARLEWLAEWCLPLVRNHGRVLAMKGPKVADELPGALNIIRRLGGAAPVVHPVVLPGTDARVIVEIKKIARTETKYPRPASRAKGKPLFGADF